MNNGQEDHKNKEEDEGERERGEWGRERNANMIMENLNKLNPATIQNIEERDRLFKLKVNINWASKRKWSVGKPPGQHGWYM
jgi:hypothetical protein